MKEVQIYVWKIEKPQEIVQSTALTIGLLLSTEKVQKSLPTGLKYFKLMRKLDDAIVDISERVETDQKNEKIIYPNQFSYVFDNEIYDMINKHLIENVPAIFGRDKNLAKSIELLIDAKDADTEVNDTASNKKKKDTK